MLSVTNWDSPALNSHLSATMEEGLDLAYICSLEHPLYFAMSMFRLCLRQTLESPGLLSRRFPAPESDAEPQKLRHTLAKRRIIQLQSLLTYCDSHALDGIQILYFASSSKLIGLAKLVNRDVHIATK